MPEFHSNQFYDRIARRYGWFFSSREGAADNLRAELLPILEKYGVKNVLDCSCGDGMQAVMLAGAGYAVDAGDISEEMLARAAEYAAEQGVKIDFRQSDFRHLEKAFPGKYDCALSWGNSIPHLMTADDIMLTLTGMRARLNPGGVAVIETRDYDKMLNERPKFQPMRINDVRDGYRYSIVYNYEYFPDKVTFNIIYLTENLESGEKGMEVESVDYNPIKRADFIGYLSQAGYSEVDSEALRRNGRNVYIAKK